jgi:hypothetical protein
MPHKPKHKDKRSKKLKDLGVKAAKKYGRVIKGAQQPLLEGGTGRSFMNPKK